MSGRDIGVPGILLACGGIWVSPAGQSSIRWG
jgi:hypothetical protein